jgi:hypothetical protein
MVTVDAITMQKRFDPETDLTLIDPRQSRGEESAGRDEGAPRSGPATFKPSAAHDVTRNADIEGRRSAAAHESDGK